MNELKIPAHSIADEQSVIGGLILAGMNGDGGRVWDLVSEILTANDFYRADHRAIYGAIAALIDRNMPIDILAISNVLRETNSLDDAGGFVYLATMAKDTPSAANIETYAKTVKTMAAKRRLVSSIQSVLDMAWSSGGATEGEFEALLGMAGDAVSRSEMELSGGDTSLTMQQAQKQALDLLNIYSQKRGGVIGIDTGLQALNDAVGGWHDTDFIVVQGRSGMGKTAFALSLAKAAAGRDRVGIISTEMATVQLAMRRISQGSGVSMTDIRKGNLDDDKWAHIARTITSDVDTGLGKRIKINDTALELDDIKRQARAWKREFGLNLLIVDYIQNVSVSNRRGISGEKVQEVMTVSRELKQLAKRLKIPVIGLAQTKRDVDTRAGDKRPTTADVMWASQIEQDADVMIGLYRHAKYFPQFGNYNDVKNISEIIIQKNRHGPVDTCYAVFLPNKMDFVDADDSGISQYFAELATPPENQRKSAAKDW